MSDFTPQVETCEIADSDLDGISGGVLGLDLGATLAPALGTVTALAPAPVTAALGQVTGMLPPQVTGALGL